MTLKTICRKWVSRGRRKIAKDRDNWKVIVKEARVLYGL